MPHVRVLSVLATPVVACVLTLAGCAPAPPERVPPPADVQPPERAPELDRNGTAASNLPYFHEEIRKFALGEAPIEGAPVVDALVAAGFDKAQMQVSFDRSKTDLVADNIFVSVLIDSDCLIAQFVVADRTFTTVVEPAVGPEKTVCLIGNTRPIDW